MKKSHHKTSVQGMVGLLAFLLILPVPAPAKSQKTKSNKAVVISDSGRYKGTLLFIDSQLLVLKEKGSGEVLGFETSSVNVVKIRKSKAAIGILAGLGIGAGVMGIIALTAPKKGDSLESAFGTTLLIGLAVGAALVFTVIFSAGGGLLGSMFGWKKYRLNEGSDAQKEETLQKLKALALLPDLTEEIKGRLIMTPK